MNENVRDGEKEKVFGKGLCLSLFLKKDENA